MSPKRNKTHSKLKQAPQKSNAVLRLEDWHLRIVILICGLGFLIYFNSLNGSFHFDDHAVIVNNPAIRNVWDFKGIFDSFNTRFIPGWTFAVNFALGQLNVQGYHFFNIWLHVCNAVWVYALANQLLLLHRGKDQSSDVRILWIACVAALIFLVHPIQSQAVNYIWQRTTLCATFFYLGSCVLYIHARTQVSRRYYVLSLFFGMFAMFSKEIAFTLPFMVLLIEAIFLRRLNSIKRSLWWVTPFLFMLLVIPLMLQRSDQLTLKIMKPHSLTRGVSDDVMSRKEYLFTQVNVTRTYLRMFFGPVHQSVDHDYPLSSQTGWGIWIASLTLLVSLLFVGFLWVRNYPLLSFGIFWFFISLLVEASVTSPDLLVEHRLYLPMVGLVFAGSFMMYQLLAIRNIQMASGVMIVLVLLLGVMTFVRNSVWQNDLMLWDDAIASFPAKARPYNNRGVVFKSINSLDLALKDFNHALAIDSNYAQAYYNRGGLYRMTGNYDLAIKDYENVLRLEPNNAQVYDALGSIYRRLDKYDEALDYFSRSLELDSTNPEVYCSRAFIYQKLGKDQLAINDYSQAIEVKPDYVYAYNNRANLYLKNKEISSALNDYNRAIELQPSFPQAYINRAVVKFEQGLYDESREDVEAAQKLGGVPKPEFLKRLNYMLDAKK